MNAENSQESLLDALQQYLQETDFAHLTSVDQPDLAALFTDLAGLKTEVKAESRHFKSTLDSLAEAVEQLKIDNQALVCQLTVAAESARRQSYETKKILLLEWLDIFDSLTAGYQVINNYRPVDSLFNHSKKRDVRFIESLAQGQEITLQRFEQALKRRKVFAIDCIGKPFDSALMNALAVASDRRVENGIVVEELRKGFMFEDQLLRLAEVKVNKL
ncbi:MAG: nucleotide exchange factor GrpE [Gammaproteobacteria bacterium]